jgi:hypothetical protein
LQYNNYRLKIKLNMMKYRIVELLNAMPYKKRVVVSSNLKEKLSLTTVQLSRRIRVKMSDTLDFKGCELPTIANELEVKIEELFTPVAKQA